MFDFNNIYEAKTLEDAIALLKEHPDAWIIAGGTDPVLAMREGHFAGRDLVSINGVKELAGISIDEEKNIHIKANTTFRQIADSNIIKENIPYFIDAVETIGGPQIRNAATIGGNISNGFTTADAPPTLFVLDTMVTISGPDGERTLPIWDYYVKSEVMDLHTGELLTDIIIPYSGYNSYACNYIKYAVRKSLDIVLLGCAVACKVSEDKSRLKEVRISYGAAGPLPLRARKTEEHLKDIKISKDIFDIIDKYVESDVMLRTDMRATKEFRLHLCKVLAKRALKKALNDQGVTEDV